MQENLGAAPEALLIKGGIGGDGGINGSGPGGNGGEQTAVQAVQAELAERLVIHLVQKEAKEG